jgi:hypothetical protein
MGWFSTCKDPHGNEFGLRRPEPPIWTAMTSEASMTTVAPDQAVLLFGRDSR